jgi:hypothetical protein
MADERIERGTCRFVARKDGSGRPTIDVQFFHRTVSVLKHARLGFNLLGGLTLEQAQNLADALNENVLDASITVSSEHPMFGERVVTSV